MAGVDWRDSQRRWLELALPMVHAGYQSQRKPAALAIRRAGSGQILCRKLETLAPIGTPLWYTLRLGNLHVCTLRPELFGQSTCIIGFDLGPEL